MAKKTASKKSAPKKSATKKAASGAGGKKSAAKKAAAKKTAAAKSSAAATKKTAASKSPTAKSAPKKTAKKAPVTPTKKSSSKKAPAPSSAKETAEKNKAESAKKFDKKFLDEQRELLLEERGRYTRSANDLQAEADSLVESREPGDVQFDEESGDGNNLAVERDRSLALSASARLSVEQIDAALGRIDAGTYGICSQSGKAIPKERLRAIPWATERVEYKVGGLRR